MIKVSRRTLFDRIGRYRIACLLIGVVLGQGLVRRALDSGLPFTAWTVVFYVGFLFLLWAVLSDYWTIYKGRRAVNRLIEAKMSERR